MRQRIQIVCNGQIIADTSAGDRALKTSHPPVYYLMNGEDIDRNNCPPSPTAG